MTNEQIIQLIRESSVCGVSFLKWDGLELGFKQIPQNDALKVPLQSQEVAPKSDVQPKHIPDLKVEDIFKPISILDEMSEKEILFYATPYYDQIQAEKAAHANKLAQETTSLREGANV